MRQLVLSIVGLLFTANYFAFGYIISLNPKEVRCFFVDLLDDQPKPVSIQFGEFDGQQMRTEQQAQSVTLSIKGPRGEIMREGIQAGSFTINPYQSGRYNYCFSNQKPNASIEVAFHISGTDLAGDTDKIKNAGKGHLDTLLRELATSLRNISSTQDFIEKHVRIHAKLAHSSGVWVVIWHFIQMALVGGVIYAQTTFIKRIFERPSKTV